jgi:AraC-like DNA-binding protein
VGVIVDTTEETPEERFDCWAAAHRLMFPSLEMTQTSDGPFSGKMSAYELGAGSLARLTADASVIRRTRRTIGADDSGWLHLALQLRGTSAVSQDDRTSVMTPGDLTSFGSWVPYEFAALTSFDLLVVSLPREMLHPHVERTRRRTATVFKSSTGVGRVMRPVLVELLRGLQDGTIRQSDAELAESLLDLVHALHANGATAGRPERRSSCLLRARIQRFIDAHLDDPRLSRETIAQRHFISMSYLDKLFEAEGTSPWRYIRDKRLDRCRRDLADLSLRTDSILDIASRWGFSNPAHFSRTFRSVYDQSPREFRRDAHTSDRDGARGADA